MVIFWDEVVILEKEEAPRIFAILVEVFLEFYIEVISGKVQFLISRF